VGGLGCVGKKTTLLQAEASARVSGLANPDKSGQVMQFCALAVHYIVFLFLSLSSKLSAVSFFLRLLVTVSRYEKLPIADSSLSTVTKDNADYNP